jgi:GGDEF domain-containing protein
VLAALGAGCLALILTMPGPPQGDPSDPVVDLLEEVVHRAPTRTVMVERLADTAQALLDSGGVLGVRVTADGADLVTQARPPRTSDRARPAVVDTLSVDGTPYRVEVVSAEPADLAGLRQRRGLLQVLTLALIALSAGGLWVSRRRHAEQERMTLLDPLTGVGNRRQLDRLAARLLREPSDGRRHALLLLDLDGFKQVNDRQGHARGDELLRRFADAVRDAVRPGDHVVRLGGDEFAVLLVDVGGAAGPASGPVGAGAGSAANEAGSGTTVDAVLERVRRLLPHVGVSGGGAHWPHDAVDLAGLMDLADRAMYTDKERRRASDRAVGAGARQA